MRIQNFAHFCTGAALAVACASVVLLGGCNKKTSPGVVPSPLPTIAGDYTGSVTDSVSGAGTGSITIAQSGASFGGTLAVTYPAATAQTFTVAASVDSTGAVNGSAVASISGATCGFTVTGAYDLTNNILNGTYTAVSGCSGQSGTFALTQQCTDPSNSYLRRLHPERTGILPC